MERGGGASQEPQEKTEILQEGTGTTPAQEVHHHSSRSCSQKKKSKGTIPISGVASLQGIVILNPIPSNTMYMSHMPHAVSVKYWMDEQISLRSQKLYPTLLQTWLFVFSISVWALPIRKQRNIIKLLRRPRSSIKMLKQTKYYLTHLSENKKNYKEQLIFGCCIPFIMGGFVTLSSWFRKNMSRIIDPKIPPFGWSASNDY